MSLGEYITYKDNKSEAEAIFLLESVIGRGGFGVVFKASLQYGEKPLRFPDYLACKKQRIKSSEELEKIKKNEIAINQKHKSKNVIYMYCSIRIKDKEEDREYIYFFYHFYNGRSLNDLMTYKKSIDEKLVAKIVKQILDGIICLHNNEYIHRDLKPDNIMIHFDNMPQDKFVSTDFLKEWDHEKHNGFTVVIVDTGYGRKANTLMLTSKIGTPLYRAPEVQEGKYDTKADIIGLGLITYELLVGRKLFTEEDADFCEEGLFELWFKVEEYSMKGATLSYESMQFLQYCLQK